MVGGMEGDVDMILWQQHNKCRFVLLVVRGRPVVVR